MSSLVILDPALVVPLAEVGPEDAIEFWGAFVEWQNDSRSRLGVRTYGFLSDFYTSSVCANPESVPAGLRRIVHQSVNRLLARGPVLHDVDGSEVTLLSPYLPPRNYRDRLVEDLVGASSANNGGFRLVLGSASRFWASEVSTIEALPPFGHVDVHVAPNRPTQDEVRLVRARLFADMRLVVFGGQVDSGVVATLSTEFGIRDSRVKWIPSEPNKKPRGVRSVVGGLDASVAVVFCITGKIGHSTSGSVAAECGRRGVRYFPVEFSSGISRVLDEMSTPVRT